MFLNFNNNMDEKAERAVVREYINDGQLELGIWNLTQRKLHLSGKIKGVVDDSFNSLADFMKAVVHPKDQAVVSHDMKNWLTYKTDSLSSTFRLQVKDNQVKWTLLKGKYIVDEKTKDELFYVTIYDVSGKNFQAGNDSETNLLNRDFFTKKLVTMLEPENSCKPFALIGINISNIQSILDAYGSIFSTLVFQETAAILNILLGKESDLAKLSSEDFVGHVSDYKDNKELVQLTESIIKAFREPLLISGHNVRVEINIGVSKYPEDSSDAIELMMYSEYATVQSKKRGIYQVLFFDESLRKSFYETILIQRELANAFQNDEFYLVFQPQVNSLTNQIIGVEALVRWNNATMGEVSPRDFIPIAEKTGYMSDLGQAIVEESIKTAKMWHELGYHFGALSINISPTEMKSTQYVNHLISLCRHYELPTHLINLEITEGIHMEAIENSYEVLNKLIWHGFKIMVDDFGVGYSNLSFLARADMDTLKIDKTLIDNIDQPAGHSILQGIVYLADNLNYNVLAEGVETEEQVHILSEMGCHLIQGYYYSKPLRLEEINKILKVGFIH